MGLLHKFKEWYQRFSTARWNAGLARRYFPEQKYVIEFAFEVAGKKYFRFSDISALPFERGLMALAVYEETQMRCGREYLLEHCRVLREIITDPQKIDIIKINTLNEQMIERLNMVTDVDLLYKLSSVVFFTRDENPVLYDAEYNRKKIEFWKKHRGVADFFFAKPLRELIPFLDNFDFDLEAYSKLNTELNQIHLERLRTLSSRNLWTRGKNGKNPSLSAVSN
jgi:hypothetical protein